MCRNCVKDPFPQRGNLCSENGAYVQNYSGCFQCKDTNRAHDALKSKCKSVITEEDEEEKEITTFEHTCAKCGHSVAKHRHEFWIEEGYQEYLMECLLCGIGQDSVSVMPKDPRKVSNILF